MIGGHAVVIGSSMAGLLAARALTDGYERVTVIDRDTLPAGLEGRRAVPQGRHAHALLPHNRANVAAYQFARTADHVSSSVAFRRRTISTT